VGINQGGGSSSDSRERDVGLVETNEFTKTRSVWMTVMCDELMAEPDDLRQWMRAYGCGEDFTEVKRDGSMY
jgi:hypothetical protein